jgi:hypothetical protein
MKIRFKKRRLIVASICLLVLILVPVIYSQTTRILFKVELYVANQAPRINVTNQSITVLNTAGGFSLLLIEFNITDQDGAGNINATTAIVNLTLGGSGGQYFYNQSWDGTSAVGTCYNHSPSATVVLMNCTVKVPYFANASSSWVLNISVEDLAGSIGRNDTVTFTVNTVTSIDLPYTNINFSSVTLGQQDVRAYPHLLVNNTGNDDFDIINITAAPLIGAITPSETIPVTSFGVNATNSSANKRQTFPSGDQTVTISEETADRNVTLIHGHTDDPTLLADKGNISLFFWVNVPSSGLSQQIYNSTWNISVS